MCGIAGWLDWRQAPDGEVVQAMTDALVHRGPDAGAVRRLDRIVLGHRRLSIIDRSHAADQPMADAVGEHWIVFNGEIYNFPALRRELEGLGHAFRTRGDTEVILAAYRQWGEACLERLNGMFAFALWDAPRQRLLLARDRCGEKPLFWAPLGPAVGGGVVFASELDSILRHPDVDGEVDPAALGDFLAMNYVVGDRTLAAGVRRLPAAHAMVVGRDRPLRMWRYWDLTPHFRAKRRFRDDGEAAEALRDLVDDAVRLRMVSDVPLGAFLSGGIDSSAMVASMCRVVPAGRVHTFTIGFREPGYDEVDQARAAADALGVDHAAQVQASDDETTLAALRRAASDPLGDSSFLPTWLLARFARERVTVAISGDGGDECFAGYDTYVADALQQRLRRLPRWMVSVGRLVATRLVPTTFGKVSFDYRLRQFLAGLPLPFVDAHWSWRSIFGAAEMADLLRPEWRDRVGVGPGLDAFRGACAEVADCHWLDRAMYMDLKTWLVDGILVKVDRATMAHSLESRAPLLDHRVVEFAASLPPHLRLRGRRRKFVLRASQRGRLPDSILHRRKRGFNAPISHWIDGALGGLVRDVVGSSALREWVRPEAVDALLDEHRRRVRDHGMRIFSLLMVGLWLEGRVARRTRAPALASSS